MSFNLKLGLIIVAIILFLFITIILRNGKMPVKYSLIWYLFSFIILLIPIVPGLFEIITKQLGFATMSNMIIGVFIVLLIVITIVLTVIVSDQKRKITLLMQEVSLLKGNRNNEK